MGEPDSKNPQSPTADDDAFLPQKGGNNKKNSAQGQSSTENSSRSPHSEAGKLRQQLDKFGGKLSRSLAKKEELRLVSCLDANPAFQKMWLKDSNDLFRLLVRLRHRSDKEPSLDGKQKAAAKGRSKKQGARE